MKNSLIFAAFLLLIILQSAIILILYNNNCSPSEGNAKQFALSARETVIQLVPSRPLVLEKVKSKIVYSKDTLILTKPFTAITDTVIVRDTVHAEWSFPEKLFTLQVRRPPDTLKSEKMFIIPENKKQLWWEKAAYFGAGTIMALIIKSL